MRINELVIHNISSFEGKCELDFRITDKKKNIILIGGKNGAGKTSIFLSIKLALYGSLCFNFQGANAVYFSKIKELINNNAFTEKEVKAFVQLNFDLYEEREYINYIIKREWIYTNKKIGEKFTVFKAGKELSDDDIIFFQTYIETVLPKNLFDFYFFDGEMIAEFFSNSNYNSYIKNALLTMYSIDTFEILRKYSSNFVIRNNSNKELEEAQNQYEELAEKINLGEYAKEELENKIIEVNDQLQEAIIQKVQIEENFHNSGGLTDEEKTNLLSRLKECEVIKTTSNLKIKSFTEDMLPFIICRDLSLRIKQQIQNEREIQQYHIVEQQLTHEFACEILRETLIEQSKESDLTIEKINSFAISMITKIKEKLKPPFDIESLILLHDLSEEQKNKVLLMTEKINTFKLNEILMAIESKSEAADNTIQINKQLRTAMEEQDIKEYLDKVSQLNAARLFAEQRLEDIQCELKRKQEYIDKLKKEKDIIYQLLVSKTQNRNVYELSQKISSVMNELVGDASRSKFKQLEESFTMILKRIMRKDNIVDYVKIDDKFNLHMYQKQVYTLNELLRLMNNIGYEEMEKRIGVIGRERLFSRYQISSFHELKKMICEDNKTESVDLYKKVEFGQLSKGEKQVFILSLYWAIIKIANHDIPFIIDTPYARIDTEHREQISNVFFPAISEQVLIFSTDEEINEYYYSVIKPYIGRAYLLQNDQTDNKTTIFNKYFFGSEDNEF